MMTSTCLITVMILGTLAANISASTDPLSSAEASDERSFQLWPADKRSRFHAGSRYGRSQGAADGDSQMVNVVPRNNRFFAGSRYGKRSGERMQLVGEPQSSRDTDAGGDGGGSGVDSGIGLVAGHLLVCRYTGVKDFYRCAQVLGEDSPPGNAVVGPMTDP